MGWHNDKEFAQYTHALCERKTVFGVPLALWNYLHLVAYLTYSPQGRVEIRCVLWIVLERCSLSSSHGGVLPKLGPWVRGGSMWWDLLLPRHPGGKRVSATRGVNTLQLKLHLMLVMNLSENYWHLFDLILPLSGENDLLLRQYFNGIKSHIFHIE